MSQKQPYKPGEFQWEFLLPKYWKIWIAITFLMLLAILPWAIQWRLAHGLAYLCWHLLKSRRKTTLRNLEVCFPEWSPAEVEAQAKQVFVDMMVGVFETLNAWYCPKWFDHRSSVEGLEHLTNAQAQGKGVLCLGIYVHAIFHWTLCIAHRTIHCSICWSIAVVHRFIAIRLIMTICVDLFVSLNKVMPFGIAQIKILV